MPAGPLEAAFRDRGRGALMGKEGWDCGRPRVGCSGGLWAQAPRKPLEEEGRPGGGESSRIPAEGHSRGRCPANTERSHCKGLVCITTCIFFI